MRFSSTRPPLSPQHAHEHHVNMIRDYFGMSCLPLHPNAIERKRRMRSSPVGKRSGGELPRTAERQQPERPPGKCQQVQRRWKRRRQTRRNPGRPSRDMHGDSHVQGGERGDRAGEGEGRERALSPSRLSVHSLRRVVSLLRLPVLCPRLPAARLCQWRGSKGQAPVREMGRTPQPREKQVS